MTQATILVFGRHPTPGQVKTRLGRDLGMSAACQIYEQLLHYTLSIVQQTPAQGFLYLPPGQTLPANAYPLEGITCHPQQGEDLGQRMHHAFQEQFEQGATRTILIGSDCPWLTPTLLCEALASLEDHETVFGPAEDGGYYLVGQRPPARDLFSSIPWSTPHVWSLTQNKLHTQKWSFKTLQKLDDIDDIDALKRYLQHTGPCPLQLPLTAKPSPSFP